MIDNQLNKWMTICYWPVPIQEFKAASLAGFHHGYTLLHPPLTNGWALLSALFSVVHKSHMGPLLSILPKEMEPLTSLADPSLPFKSLSLNIILSSNQSYCSHPTLMIIRYLSRKKELVVVAYWVLPSCLALWQVHVCSQHPCQGRGFPMSSVQ